jgi:hypothetical protein
VLRTAALATSLVMVLCLLGCAGPDGEATGSSTSTATARSAAVSSPATSPSPVSPSQSPSPTPTYVPKLPTAMSDDGGSCVGEGHCGNYVAGPTCRGIEWCDKKALVEPGLWSTEGGDGLTECMWELSKPPKYEFDDGGYAEEGEYVFVPKGAIFDTDDCPNDWTWLQP